MYTEFVDPTTGSSEQYCLIWGTQYLEMQSLMVASVLVVVIINACLTPFMQMLVLKQKNHTLSENVVAIVTKIFLSQFFNTSVIVVFLNANLDFFKEKSNGVSIGSFTLLNGKYSDFSVSWYNDVGVSLLLTMLINAVSPHVGIFITYIWLEMKRWADRSFSFNFSYTRQETQRDLESLYRGPEFNLATRYSQILNTIFITLLVSSY